MAVGWLLVKEARLLSALRLQGDIDIFKLNIRNHRLLLAADKERGFGIYCYILHSDISYNARERIASFSISCVKENRLAVAPPSFRKVIGSFSVCVFQGVAADIFNADIFNRSSVPNPKTDSAGAVSYNAIETELVETEHGNFSRLILADAVACGEIGAPSLPITKKLIAVPFGTTPSVKIASFSTADYKLSDYGIERVYPQQPSYSKDTKVEEVVFQYNKSAYKTRSFANAPEVKVEMLGTMRGVQIASLQVEPISYNPSNNTIRVFNDINFEVDFEGADIELTEDILVASYSPYYDVVYKQMFNSRTLADVFYEHPDLYETPVRMTVVANEMFEEALQPWLAWKTQKGFYIDVKYVESTTSSSIIKSYVKEQYNTVKPSFLVIVGFNNVLDEIFNPRMIIKENENKIIIFTNCYDYMERQIIVPIEINTKSELNKVRIEANVILSLHGRKNIDNFIKNLLDKGSIIIYKKTQNFSDSRKVPYPEGISSVSAYNNNIK